MPPGHKIALKIGQWFEASAEGWIGIGALMSALVLAVLLKVGGYW